MTIGELDGRFGDPVAQAPAWPDVEARLRAAEIYWISTVRADGRPHVTPLIGIWQDGLLVFCTGGGEQKALNLAGNPHCVMTTGCNALSEGMDIVVEGVAVRVTDTDRLRILAAAYEQKYGADWHFDVDDGGFRNGRGVALVFAIAPVKMLAFGKGEFSQTRWTFGGRS